MTYKFNVFTGNLDEVGAGSSITGSDTQVLFFDGANNPAGDAGLTYVKATDTLTIAGSQVVPLISGSTAANGDITINGTTSATKDTSYVLLQDTGGNVGIGVTAPGDVLHVNGNLRLVNTGPVYPVKLKMAGDFSVLEATSSQQLRINQEGWAEVLIPNGLVGIGTTTTPTAKLQVTGVTGSAKALVVNNGTSTGNIFEAQDNGTAVFTVADGGMLTIAKSANAMQFTADSYINWKGNSDIGNANLLVAAGTGSSWASTDLAVRGASRVFLSSGATAGLMLGSDLGVTIGSSSVTGTAKALTVNNGTSTGNIFEAQDNGTAVFTVADGGATTLTGRLFMPNGSESLPSFSYSSETTSGFFSAGSGTIAFSRTGATKFAFAADTSFADAFRLTSTVGLGWASGSALSAQMDLMLSREAAAILQMGLDVNGSPINQTFKAHDGITGTDISGASLTLAGGRGTGTGVGADFVVQTAKPLATGTTAQTLGDRERILQKYTTLTAATPTVVATVGVATGIATGGDILISVEANDGTDFQCRTLRVGWSAVNKAGTITAAIDTPSEAIAVSSGTLTATVTVADAGSGILNILVDAASSLTETVLRANCQVRKNFGTGAIA